MMTMKTTRQAVRASANSSAKLGSTQLSFFVCAQLVRDIADVRILEAAVLLAFEVSSDEQATAEGCRRGCLATECHRV